MKEDIIKIINEQVQNELNDIKKSAEARANRIYKIYEEELKRSLNEKINKEKTEVIDKHDQQRREIERNVNLSVEKARYEVVDKVYALVREKLTKELETNLLEFISHKLDNLNLSTNEVYIAVNENDFNVFGKQLGFDSKTNELKLLNEKYPNNKFYLKTSENVLNGIVIIGSDYDVNFTVDTIIENLKRTTLTTVFKELFIDER